MTDLDRIKASNEARERDIAPLADVGSIHLAPSTTAMALALRKAWDLGKAYGVAEERQRQQEEALNGVDTH